MWPRKHRAVGGVAALSLLAALAPGAATAESSPAEQQSLEELRNTLVNLLQAMVSKGLLTREQAELLVKQAQDKAAADAAASAAQKAEQAKEEAGAVRVPYVPQIVKDEISKQVAQEVKPAVVADVVQQAKTERWGVPGALPEWLARIRPFGDVTVRGEFDNYPADNSYHQLLDYNAINAAGGISKATYPFLNTTEDQYRVRVRARLGVEGDLTDTVRAVIRLSTGSLTTLAPSASQTLGQYGNRYTIGVDEAYIIWDTSPREELAINTLAGGRIPNPWFAPTELIYARDLTFEGVVDTLRLGWGEGDADASHLFLTLGGFPMLEMPQQASQDKWMVGGQLGTHLRFADGSDHLSIAAAYYDFINITGIKNAPDSTLTNYTAPPFFQWGNSVYDISNSTTDFTVNLFALAAHFRLATLAGRYEHAFNRYSLAVSGDAVRNVGYNLAQIEEFTQQPILSPQNRGYVGEVSFGDRVVDRLLAWRAAVGYRWVQGDAVLDAWTDADFHGGGTNAAGYYFWGSLGLARNTWVRLRYLSANELTGPRYGWDTVQLDFNTRF